MIAQTVPASGMPPEDSGRPSSTGESPDREALNALFKLIGMTEPALLLCRDALVASCRHTDEVIAIQACLDHIGELKANRLGFPPRP